MQLEARPAATSNDLEAAASLIEAARDEAMGERGGPLLVEQSRPTGELLSHLAKRNEEADALVALGLLDDVPVGVGLVTLLPPTGASRLAVVEAIFVDPAARSVGVGEELLELMTSWSIEHGATGIDVPVLPGMRDSKNFFETAGYVARSIVMHRRLAGPDG